MTVNLEPFTVFVGANGSGKTSFLQALDLLCRTFRTLAVPPGVPVQIGQLDGEYQSNRSYGATEEVELSCVSGASHYRYRPTAQPQQPHFQPQEKSVFVSQHRRGRSVGVVRPAEAGTPTQQGRAFGWRPGFSRYLVFDHLRVGVTPGEGRRKTG